MSREVLNKAKGALWPFAQLKLAEGQNGAEFFITRGEIENAVEAFYETRAALVAIHPKKLGRLRSDRA